MLVGALVMAFAGLIIVGVSSGIFLIGRAVIDNRAQVEQVQGDGGERRHRDQLPAVLPEKTERIRN